MELFSPHSPSPETSILENLWVFTTLRQTVPPFFHNGSQISHSSEKVEVLANQFKWSLHLTLHMGTPHHSQVITCAVNRIFCRPTPPVPKSYLTSPSEVQRHIFSLKIRTAPSNDGISTVMLWHLPTYALLHLTFLFNPILQFSYFTTWKVAKVIPKWK
jgi:hypothetical protein